MGMKKLGLGLVFTAAFTLSSVSVMAEKESECGFAVDMADSGNLEEFHDCHQETGLNRFLKDVLKSKETEKKAAAKPIDVTSEPLKSPASYPVTTPQITGMDSSERKSTSASAVAHLQSRQQLLMELAKECPKGFVVESEEYRPAKNSDLTLFLNYRCIEDE